MGWRIKTQQDWQRSLNCHSLHNERKGKTWFPIILASKISKGILCINLN